MSQPLELDNTKRSQFITCDRRYYWQYIRNLRPLQGSTALRYGITWHSMIEAFYSHIKEHGWQHDGKAIEAAIAAAKASWEEISSKQSFYDDYRTLENCIQALLSYIGHFNYDEGMLKVVKTERPFKLSMKLSASEEQAFPLVAQKGLLFAGRIDAEVLLNGRLWQLEQKTTGQALSVQKARLHRSSQLIGYTYAGQRLSKEAEAPDGTLMVLHHLSAYKSKKTGEYGNPKIDFERIPQIYTDGDLQSWRLSFLDTADRILRNEERNVWPMQYDNCYQYGRCSFAALCEQNQPLGEEILDGFYEDEPWSPAKDVEIID